MNRIFVAILIGLTYAAPVRGSGPQPVDFTTLSGSWTEFSQYTTGGFTRHPGLAPTKDSGGRYSGTVYTFDGSELVIKEFGGGATRARLQMGAPQGRAGSFLVVSDPPGLGNQWMLFERQGEWLKIATHPFDGSLPTSFEPRPGLQVALLLSASGLEARKPCRVLRKARVEEWLGFTPEFRDRGFEAPIPGPICVTKRERGEQREVALITVLGATITDLLNDARARSSQSGWQREPDLGEAAFSVVSEERGEVGFVVYKNHVIVLLTSRWGPKATLAQMRGFARRVLAEF